MMQVWCCIPVYNNAATIVDVARRCRRQIPQVVVVDDGSTDADLRELLKSLDVAVARHPTNLGKGAALLTAFTYAAQRGAEYLITLDGDGQHFPEDIPLFLARLTPDTILIGNRDEVVGVMPRSSLFGREFSDFWICCETGAAVRDSQSGFRAYPVAHVLKLKLDSRHYNLEMEVITRAVWAGLGVGSVPIRVWYPEPSQRVSSFHPFHDNLRISRLHLRLILRALLPIPHQRIAGIAPSPARTFGDWFDYFCMENSTPGGLAVAAALSLLLGIVLWPWGAIVVLYLAIRLHLNKVLMVTSLAVCVPRPLPALCFQIGRHLLGAHASPRLAWFVGSHLVAFVLAPVLAVVVYAVARYFRLEDKPQ